MHKDEKPCVPCEENHGHLLNAEIQTRLPRVPNWTFADYHHLSRSFGFKDFKDALSFVNRVGELAEKEGHHPDIELSWGKVSIKLFTHNVDGLTDNDFILAEKIDHLKEEK